MPRSQAWESSRHRTAIGRRGLSMPARLALQDGLIEPGTAYFDYGSGRGQDVQRLRSLGFEARGWDPHFDSREGVSPADTIMLSYVLNVIETPRERSDTLRHAWGLARRQLVVATRLSWDRSKVHGTQAWDGVITSRDTFQHLYRPRELHELVEQVTGERCVSAAPGVIYAFRHQKDRLAYLARASASNFSWADPQDLAAALAAAAEFVSDHGRLPTFDEFPTQVRMVFAGLSRSELGRLIRREVTPDEWASGARRATLDVLLYLGMAIFQGRPKHADLPLSIRLDIRNQFSSYGEACRRADRLLLKLRDDGYVRGAMRNSVGKLTPTALYVHRRAQRQMPVVLRLYEYCGTVAAGRPEDWNVLKLHHDRRRVAWSCYPEFDRDPHPRLAWTYGTDLGTLESTWRDYRGVSNRPLLHRKHEFEARRSEYEKALRLTKSELRAGLYEEPSLIGPQDGWNAVLARQGVQLRGHRLVRRG